MGRTGIQWTDFVWNPVTGCTKVSQGCKHCYAKALHDQRHRAHLAGKVVARQYAAPFERVQLMPERLQHPLGWRAPRRIFVNSVSDLFHVDVPVAYIARVWAIMALTPRHTYQVLTKRPERMRAVLAGDFREAVTDAAIAMNDRRADARWMERGDAAPWPLPNVWLGTSVEHQAAADGRIPELLQTPAAVRFLSCEPLLGPVDISGWTGVLVPNGEGGHVVFSDDGSGTFPRSIDWVIVGGESGRGARPMDLAWARALRDQCQEEGIAFHFKQVGGRTPKSGGRELDGRTWDEFPGVEVPAHA